MRDNEIQKLRRTGKRMTSTHFDVRSSDSLFSQGRIGVIVPKFGHTVVDRNRLRRQVREIARTVLLPALGPRDILIRVLAAAYGMEFKLLRVELEEIFSHMRAGAA